MSKKHLVIILLAVLLVALLIIIFCMNDSGAKTAIVSVLCSGIAGLLVSYYADIPDIIDSTTKATADSFLSLKFLEQYSPERLEKFRERTIDLRYKEDEKEILPDIYKIESQVCDLMDEAYYERYSESHVYSLEKGNRVKTITVDYLIKNNAIKHPATIDIGILKFFPKVYSKEDIEHFIMNDFKISIDGSGRKSIESHIDKVITPAIEEEDINQQAYNSAFRFFYNGELNKHNLNEFCRAGYLTNVAPDCKRGMRVSFENEVSVHAMYTIPFDEDLVFVKKMRYFAKSFTFDSNTPEGYGIEGSLLSPFAQGEQSLVSVSKDNLQIDCYTGMLPGSGIVYSLYKKPEGNGV